MSTAKLNQLDPAEINKNPENPRIHFPESELDDLAASIDAQGILVPISVYENGKKSGAKYFLIDGERRWRCSLKLGLKKIPAIVMPTPNPIDNLKTMFNIHMFREEWAEMPTAWALEKLMQRTNESDIKKLAEITGMSSEKLKRYTFALELPKKYQNLIDSGEVPLNFFYELDRNVIKPMAKQRPALLAKFNEKLIYQSFVDKKRAHVITDTVDLRRMRPIIEIAAQEAGAPEKDSDLDKEIEKLIQNKNQTIQETYEDTVEMVVEADKFARQCDLIVRRFDRLVSKADSDDERASIYDSIEKLVVTLNKRLKSRG